MGGQLNGPGKSQARGGDCRSAGSIARDLVGPRAASHHQLAAATDQVGHRPAEPRRRQRRRLLDDAPWGRIEAVPLEYVARGGRQRDLALRRIQQRLGGQGRGQARLPSDIPLVGVDGGHDDAGHRGRLPDVENRGTDGPRHLRGGPLRRVGPGGRQLLVGRPHVEGRQLPAGDETPGACSKGKRTSPGPSSSRAPHASRSGSARGGGQLPDVDLAGIGGHEHAVVAGRRGRVNVPFHRDRLRQMQGRRGRFRPPGLDLEHVQRGLVHALVDRDQQVIAKEHRRRGDGAGRLAEGEHLPALPVGQGQHEQILLVGQLEEQFVRRVDGRGQRQRLRQLHVAGRFAALRIDPEQPPVEGGHQDQAVGGHRIGGEVLFDDMPPAGPAGGRFDPLDFAVRSGGQDHVAALRRHRAGKAPAVGLPRIPADELPP